MGVADQKKSKLSLVTTQEKCIVRHSSGEKFHSCTVALIGARSFQLGPFRQLARHRRSLLTVTKCPRQSPRRLAGLPNLLKAMLW
jgi:hypothetical protein